MDREATANVVFLLAIVALVHIGIMRAKGERGYVITSAFGAFMAILAAYEHFWAFMGFAMLGSAFYLFMAIRPDKP